MKYLFLLIPFNRLFKVFFFLFNTIKMLFYRKEERGREGGGDCYWIRKICCTLWTYFSCGFLLGCRSNSSLCNHGKLRRRSVGSPGDRKYLPVARFPSKCSFWLPRRANSHRQRNALVAMRRAAVHRRLLAPLISSAKVDVWRRYAHALVHHWTSHNSATLMYSAK